MRIVAGRLKGRPLAEPPSDAIRPTSDRVREAVFNILEHGIDGASITDARVFDLFAGTGALGLEALSRGAKSCLFVDRDPAARAVIRTNIERLGLGGVTRILNADATDLGISRNRNTFSLVFLDPPYGQSLGEAALRSALDNGWLEPGAIIVAEEATPTPIAFPDGIVELDRRTYGGTEVGFAKVMDATSARNVG